MVLISTSSQFMVDYSQPSELTVPQWSHWLGFRLLKRIHNILCPSYTQSSVSLQSCLTVNLVELP